ncbi:uncharacterized protein LOC115216612 [Octopus sinensis]|uniref:Uncharacterized protein LOC115216612 n=1 Tax=Octopus sinensis TaxID=2607531 RepID=A0A6P7SUM5_9MOLL|nr:uncharacterized protein LOC115216612 [Octopus sinensis]
MLAELYDPWLRSIRWNILLILGFCIQDVFAASNSMELGGVIAAGLMGLFLLTSAIIAMVFFCRRLKENRKKQVSKVQQIKKLEGSICQSQSEDVLGVPVVTNALPRIVNDDMYMGSLNNIYNGSIINHNPLHALSQSKANYDGDSDRKGVDQNYESITDYNTSQPLNPSVLQTRAMVHEKYDYSTREPDRDLAASKSDSEFILRKPEAIQLIETRSKGNELEEFTATEFMLDRKKERSSERSDLRFVTNDNNNSYSLQNGGRFVTVGERPKDVYPVPDYDGSGNEPDNSKITENNTHGYDMDLQEIKKNFSLDEFDRSYKGNWYDTYSKQVQFNSNPENIAISNVSLRL